MQHGAAKAGTTTASPLQNLTAIRSPEGRSRIGRERRRDQHLSPVTSSRARDKKSNAGRRAVHRAPRQATAPCADWFGKPCFPAPVRASAAARRPAHRRGATPRSAARRGEQTIMLTRANPVTDATHALCRSRCWQRAAPSFTHALRARARGVRPPVSPLRLRRGRRAAGAVAPRQRARASLRPHRRGAPPPFNGPPRFARPQAHPCYVRSFPFSSTRVKGAMPRCVRRQQPWDAAPRRCAMSCAHP